ncbi:hypothetical protein DBV15_01299 [Temnothorax longispinosus]|uniref:Uncharacterized protein n=1 Tax=Temnothorax longispinosus TaxID=300112 RepID=A0A4S2KP19_9HYME|nr:hypothetical protein DBV15_01299 [Temnothorax longispinosus]
MRFRGQIPPVTSESTVLNPSLFHFGLGIRKYSLYAYTAYKYVSACVGWQCGLVVKRQTRNSEEPSSSPPDHRNFYIPNCTPRTSGARVEKLGYLSEETLNLIIIGRQAWGAWEFW